MGQPTVETVDGRPDLPGTLLLAGIVGSTAYGLAGPSSDIDRLGLYAAPTTALHGLSAPKETVHTTGPDATYHEAAKWCRLALGGNPTVMELVWLDDYEVRTELGDELIAIRSAFLSRSRVRAAYLGYASQQFRKLEQRNGTFSSDTAKRTAKHARHLARLLQQGVELYETGHLRIRLEHPTWYHEFGEIVADGDIREARDELRKAEQHFDRARSTLPETPDVARVEAWLQRVRRAHLG